MHFWGGNFIFTVQNSQLLPFSSDLGGGSREEQSLWLGALMLPLMPPLRVGALCLCHGGTLPLPPLICMPLNKPYANIRPIVKYVMSDADQMPWNYYFCVIIHDTAAIVSVATFSPISVAILRRFALVMQLFIQWPFVDVILPQLHLSRPLESETLSITLGKVLIFATFTCVTTNFAKAKSVNFNTQIA